MPETFDLQSRFDRLARDVSRAAGPGDADLPIGRARRRRAVSGAVALAVAVTIGVTAVQVVGQDGRGSAPDIADSRGETSPGAARRERLLGLLPPDSRHVSVLDVAGFTGEDGLDGQDPGDQDLLGYLMSSFVTLQRGPLPQLLLPDLVAYAGTGATDLYLVDRPADEITDRMVRAGWEDDSGVLVPGADVPNLAASLAPHLQVTDHGDRALVAIARDRDDLPGAGTRTPDPGSPAARLVDLGGALGQSFDQTGGCSLEAFSLSSPTEGTVLVGPPPGTSAGDVTIDQLEVPDGFSSIEAVAPAGRSVRARVTVASAAAPLELVTRLGLPGTDFC